MSTPDYDDLMNEFYDPESSAPWYVTVRAVEEYRNKYAKYPGLKDD